MKLKSKSEKMSTIFIAVQCCQCYTMQVKQRKKSNNKYTCVVCNQKQSVLKIFAQALMAEDVLKFVQSFNMSRQLAEQNQSFESGEETLGSLLPEVEVDDRSPSNWKEIRTGRTEDIDLEQEEDDAHNPGSRIMQSQLNSQGLPLPVPVPTNLSQSVGQLLPQNIANNMASGGKQGSAGLASLLSPLSRLSQNTIPNIVNQNSNSQDMLNISGVLLNNVASTIGQRVPSNVFANSQRQMEPGRQQQGISQLQRQSQNSQQHLMKQKYQSGSMSQSQMHSHIQQQQQNPLQSNQPRSSQQSVAQPTKMQSPPFSSLQHNQQSSTQQSTEFVLQQHTQITRQRYQQQVSNIHQQQTALQLSSAIDMQQQQQHLVGQLSSAIDMQQIQLVQQQNSISDIQQQQQERLVHQQNNFSDPQQQQSLGLPNQLPYMHQRQLGPQGDVNGLQQQHRLLGAQSGTSIMPNYQHYVHMLQQSKVPLQQTQLNMSNSLSSQGSWRTQLEPDIRQRIVNKILDTLKRLLFCGQELERLAVRFEQKVYTTATSQSDYLRIISLMMLMIETNNSMPDKMQSNSGNYPPDPQDPGSQSMQSQLNSHTPPLPVPLQQSKVPLPLQQTQQDMSNLLPSQDNWRNQLHPNARQRIVNKIWETLKRHLPLYGQELKILAVRFEQKVYTTSTSQFDYLRNISLKMLTVETTIPIPNNMQSNSANIGPNPRDPGSQLSDD